MVQSLLVGLQECLSNDLSQQIAVNISNTVACNSGVPYGSVIKGLEYQPFIVS